MSKPLRFKTSNEASTGGKPAIKLSAGERLQLVRQFVARVGGTENAKAALAMLTIMSRAA